VQGFKRKGGAIGNPRPKKTKVVVTEDLGSGGTSAATGTSVEEAASGSNVVEQDGEPCESVEDSEEEEEEDLRKELAAVIKQARGNVNEAKVDVRKAEAALRHEQRLDEERNKRWWAAEKRKEPPPAYLQLERAYKAQVKDLKARLGLALAQKLAAEAEVELRGLLLAREEHAHAMTRCKL
jgi:hypothetical protein